MIGLPWIKMGAIAGVLLAVWLAWNHYESLLEDNRTLASNNEKLAVTVEAQQRAAEELARATMRVNDELSQARNDAQKQQEVLKDHDLEKIVKAKPNLFLARANRATRRMFDSIEDAANDSGAGAVPAAADGGPSQPD